MDRKPSDAYAARFERVFDYIDRHLGEPLTVAQLSSVANFSRYHFQRQFSDYVGMSVVRYIQLLRLRRASYRLVFTERMRVLDIAQEAAFEGSESFARAFKRTFGQTPSQFRTQPAWQPWKERMQLPERERSSPMEVRIVDFKQTQVAVLEHHGPAERVNDSVRIFIDWRKSSGLSPIATSRTFGLVHSDPETTAPDAFRFDICGEVSAPVPDNPQGVTTGQIPSGRCATVRHYGPTERIGDSAYYLYREWLPESGEELRDFPIFYHYLKRPPETPEHELVTDIYLPLL